MLIGQGLLIVSTPLLTRIYTPEDFGLFAVFGALTSILIAIVTLKYENAIPLERDDRAALALVAGVGLTSLSFSVVAALVIMVGGAKFGQLLGLPELEPLLWLLPPCILLWGCGSGLSFWSVRQGTFRLNGANRVIHHSTQAVGQLGFGLAGLGGAGLVLGYALGYLARFTHFLAALSKVEILAFSRQPFAEIGHALRRYWRHPVFAAGSSLLQTTSVMLPAVLITILYGPAMAGWYALAQRVVALPLRLLGEGASEVFLGEIRTVDHAGLIRLFKRVTALFAGIGLVVLLPLVWLAPWLFSIVFGAAWHDAGVICQLLVPVYLAQFVVHPISQIWNVLKRQELYLLSSMCSGASLIFCFSLGWWLGLDARWTIALFSGSSSLVFLLTIAVAWRILRRVDWATLQAAH